MIILDIYVRVCLMYIEFLVTRPVLASALALRSLSVFPNPHDTTSGDEMRDL